MYGNSVYFLLNILEVPNCSKTESINFLKEAKEIPGNGDAEKRSGVPVGVWDDF